MNIFDEEHAPITYRALGKCEGEQGPPPLILEWDSITTQNQDIVVLWAGSWNRNGRTISWASHTARIGSPEEHPAVKTPPAKVERLLAPLAHEGRVKMLQALYDGAKTANQLAGISGLKGGNLYYHLKELLYTEYIEEKNGTYDLTSFGCKMLITMSLVADEHIKD